MGLVKANDLSFSMREIESVSQVIFDRVYNESDITEYHDIETGVDVTTQIAFAKRMALLGQLSDGCTPNEADGFTFTEKKWEPVLEDFRLTHCQADMPALARIFRKAQRINPDFYDAVGSQEFGVVIAAVEASLVENIHRKVWFNDTAAATIADSGVFKNGTALGYFNSFNGLFKQIMTHNSNPDNADDQLKRVTIAKNSQTTYAGQALEADAAIAVFEKMLTEADERLIAADDAFILATRSLAENYRATLRNKNLGAGFLEVVEEGRPKLYFDGIEIKVRYDWDRYIKTYQENGTKWNLPHRAVFTTKSNIPVGTLNEQDLAKLDVFYDRKSKTNNIDAAYTLDAKLLEGYMMVAAY